MKFSEKAMEDAVRKASNVFDVMSPPENDRSWHEIVERMLLAAAPTLVRDVQENEPDPRFQFPPQPLQMDDPEYDYAERKPRQPIPTSVVVVGCIIGIALSILVGGWGMFMVMTS